MPFIEIKEAAWKSYPVRTHSREELSIGFVEGGSSTITCKALKFKMPCLAGPEKKINRLTGSLGLYR